jgi:hypothetical protein
MIAVSLLAGASDAQLAMVLLIAGAIAALILLSTSRD